MSKFQSIKRLPLDFVGEGWNDCYLLLTPFSPQDVLANLRATPEESTQEATFVRGLELLKAHVVGGQGLTAEGVVEIKPEDVEHLPLEVAEKALTFLNGQVSPNSETTSNA